jgi:glycosyltransferase involved in cell wall biosynthesis
VTIAHVGHFDPNYARNRIMAKALERAGARVRVVSDGRTFFHRTPRLLRELIHGPSDVVLVGFPGHSDVPLARACGLWDRGPVLFDAFVSRYETGEDRGTAPSGSLRSLSNALQDRLACALAARVICDTDAHADFFETHVGVPRAKLRRIWVGSDDDVMRPAPFPDDAAPFRVFVYASFIPLHGLEHVVRAAHLLEQSGEDVKIDIVGTGATEDAVKRLAAELRVQSVRFLGRRSYEQLPSEIARSHVCLGIFGTSPKAQRVIPNKVFDALAVARPVITGDTPAVREVLTHGENAWLCPPGNPEALAEAVLTLRSDEVTRRRIAELGHALFERRFSIDALSRDVATIVVDVLGLSSPSSRARAAEGVSN